MKPADFSAQGPESLLLTKDEALVGREALRLLVRKLGSRTAGGARCLALARDLSKMIRAAETLTPKGTKASLILYGNATVGHFVSAVREALPDLAPDDQGQASQMLGEYDQTIANQTPESDT